MQSTVLSYKLSTSPILLFDGVCNLCNGVVQFVLKNEAENSERPLLFASLQSQFGQQILQSHNLPTDSFKSFVLLDNNQLYFRSSAAFRLCKYLKFPWSWLSVLQIIPTFLRDSVYQFVSDNRYRWFGKKEQCWIPTPELKSRFLD
ncbi:MAG: thiol-disulfide oxidoreductase DCC family protein [Chitinophagales bacterium]|nr:thiol-disulfide oxidoreductase DCC family protein [Bacteroidota bacterium]MCB9042209.1 thiol-disulfide oxidoreductase DCC family protein [Chitinophagales bacterium]